MDKLKVDRWSTSVLPFLRVGACCFAACRGVWSSLPRRLPLGLALSAGCALCLRTPVCGLGVPLCGGQVAWPSSGFPRAPAFLAALSWALFARCAFSLRHALAGSAVPGVPPCGCPALLASLWPPCACVSSRRFFSGPFRCARFSARVVWSGCPLAVRLLLAHAVSRSLGCHRAAA